MALLTASLFFKSIPLNFGIGVAEFCGIDYVGGGIERSQIWNGGCGWILIDDNPGVTQMPGLSADQSRKRGQNLILNELSGWN